MSGILIREVAYRGESVNLLLAGHKAELAPAQPMHDVQVIEARGLTAISPLWDGHVHFREPGFTDKEDLLSGARAMAAGGYLLADCEPNTRPVIDTCAAVDAHYQRLRALDLPVQISTKVALTRGQRGEELIDITDDLLLTAGISGISSDGEPVVDRALLVQALRKVNGRTAIALHCEETPQAAPRIREVLGAGAPFAREPELIRLALQAMEEAGGVGEWIHLQHVSLAESVQLIAAAKQHKLHVTAEVTPHHLLLCEEDIPLRGGEPDANWKMNPPLRSRADMLAVRRALAAGHYRLYRDRSRAAYPGGESPNRGRPPSA